MNTRLLAAFAALLTTTACEGPEPEPEWSDLQCWESPAGPEPTCIGTREGVTVRVIADSVLSQAMAEPGRYENVRSVECVLGPEVLDAMCFDATYLSGATVCVGNIDGVWVPSPDPCGDAPDWDWIDMGGLYAWPDGADAYNDLEPVEWPG